MITFWVPGIPVQEGNLITVGEGDKRRNIHREGKRLKDWRTDIGWRAREAGAELLGGDGIGVAIKMLFVMPRAKSRTLKHRWPTFRPDLIKLARAVEDALSEIAYDDDKRICQAFLKEWYEGDPAGPRGGEEPGVEITLHELPGWPEGFKPQRV